MCSLIVTSTPPPGCEATSGRPLYAYAWGRAVDTNMWDGFLDANYHALQIVHEPPVSAGGISNQGRLHIFKGNQRNRPRRMGRHRLESSGLGDPIETVRSRVTIAPTSCRCRLIFGTAVRPGKTICVCKAAPFAFLDPAELAGEQLLAHTPNVLFTVTASRSFAEPTWKFSNRGSD